jgi:hypothetical protein
MKAARSFFSLFLGWLAACGWDYFSKLCSGAGFIDQTLFLSVYHAAVSILGWLLFGLPTIFLAPQRWASRWYICLSVGITIGVLAYLLLLCTWCPDGLRLPWFPSFPAILGGVGGLSYWLLGTAPANRIQQRSQPVSIAALYLLPCFAYLTFLFVVWPALIKWSPHVVYRFGDGESRSRAEYQIFTHIKAGDTFSELHQRYPAVFDKPILGGSGSGHVGKFAWSYRIKFDESRRYVTQVDVKRDSR